MKLCIPVPQCKLYTNGKNKCIASFYSQPSYPKVTYILLKNTQQCLPNTDMEMSLSRAEQHLLMHGTHVCLSVSKTEMKRTKGKCTTIR